MRVMLTLSRLNARFLCKLLTVKRHRRAEITIMKMSAGLSEYSNNMQNGFFQLPAVSN